MDRTPDDPGDDVDLTLLGPVAAAAGRRGRSRPARQRIDQVDQYQL
ncbi:hypothetical protein [Phytoactinopolyspora halotolerans]|uniref:Uncharacterized protein n=1 Tax=Phytoactinopolyspora halotolerans TaxID=1981512 RepID=A0A6L9S3V4_9ACTN|nr:hypothetical protein [Phytoactinopolyspora halotolerans]NED98649.1 hypothetical protein [Phytoactinopolyspora halotolerans]